MPVPRTRVIRVKVKLPQNAPRAVTEAFGGVQFKNGLTGKVFGRGMLYGYHELITYQWSLGRLSARYGRKRLCRIEVRGIFQKEEPKNERKFFGKMLDDAMSRLTDVVVVTLSKSLPIGKVIEVELVFVRPRLVIGGTKKSVRRSFKVKRTTNGTDRLDD